MPTEPISPEGDAPPPHHPRKRMGAGHLQQCPGCGRPEQLNRFGDCADCAAAFAAAMQDRARVGIERHRVG